MAGAKVIAVTAEPGKQREFAGTAELGRTPSCMVQYCYTSSTAQGGGGSFKDQIGYCRRGELL
jgi:hypothetical protein